MIKERPNLMAAQYVATDASDNDQAVEWLMEYHEIPSKKVANSWIDRASKILEAEIRKEQSAPIYVEHMLDNPEEYGLT